MNLLAVRAGSTKRIIGAPHYLPQPCPLSAPTCFATLISGSTMLSRCLHQSSGAFVSTRPACGADGRTATAGWSTASTPCLSGGTLDVVFGQGRVGIASACCHSSCARGASHASASTSATTSRPVTCRGGVSGNSRRGWRMLTTAAADKTAPTTVGAMPPPQRPIKYSPLHANIEEFSQRVTLSEEEQRARNEVIET